jgi:hypothetical protein
LTVLTETRVDRVGPTRIGRDQSRGAGARCGKGFDILVSQIINHGLSSLSTFEKDLGLPVALQVGDQGRGGKADDDGDDRQRHQGFHQREPRALGGGPALGFFFVVLTHKPPADAEHHSPNGARCAIAPLRLSTGETVPLIRGHEFAYAPEVVSYYGAGLSWTVTS